MFNKVLCNKKVETNEYDKRQRRFTRLNQAYLSNWCNVSYKRIVYEPILPETIQELKQRIAFAVALVRPDKLQKIKNNMTRRLNKTLEVEGRHFENIKVDFFYYGTYQLNRYSWIKPFKSSFPLSYICLIQTFCYTEKFRPEFPSIFAFFQKIPFF